MVDTQSNKADYARSFQLWDPVANEYINAVTNPIDDIKLELEDPRTRNPKLNGSLLTGEIVADLPEEGIFSFRFPASEMEDIREGRYLLGIIVIAQGETIQAAVEPVNIFRGIVGEG